MCELHKAEAPAKNQLNKNASAVSNAEALPQREENAVSSLNAEPQKTPLGGGVIIYSTPEYRYGTDAVILAHFAGVRKNDTVCDLGCGGGIIPLIHCRNGVGKTLYGVDIQAAACDLAKRAAEENGFTNLKIINADIRDIDTLKRSLPLSAMDVVTCNPPYKKSGAGITNPNDARYIARHEAECTLSDVCNAAKRLLRSGGRLCVCHRPERLADIFAAMRENKIEPKTLRTVHQRKDTEPWLILVEGRRDGNSGMKIMPPLYIEGENGEPNSPEMLTIYGNYKDGHI